MNKTRLKEFQQLIEKFRVYDPEMQCQQILTLLNVCLKQNHPDGYSVRELADELKLTQASASRNMMQWSKLTRRKQAGPDMIKATECPVNRSRKRLFLTGKGERFLEGLFPA
jgi:DNA-binding MarR family transcriptional regulator